MAESVDPLVVGRVIGDVVDMFVPTATLTASYGSTQVTNACEIKPSQSANPPKVAVSGSDRLYTLVMVDPDAPSPTDPTMREWVHWIVVDIPPGTDGVQGREILPYVGPSPPVGMHRYVFVLFQQSAPVGLVEPPLSRANFSTRSFSATLGLGLPVAALYFKAQKEAASATG